MPKPIFHIEMKGMDVYPQSTPIRELADFLINLESAIAEIAKAQQVELEPGEVGVSLVEIQEGSNRLGIAVESAFIGAVSVLTNSLSQEDFSSLPRPAHDSLYEIYKQTQRTKWEVNFLRDESQSIKDAAISSQRPVPNPLPATIRGTTTVFGRCIKVGGAEPKVDIRLPNRSRLLHVEVTETMAKKLARNLYENVAITGEVWWEPQTYEIVRLKAKEVVNIQAGSPLQTFKELAEIVGERWRHVNVEQFVRDIRSGEEG